MTNQLADYRDCMELAGEIAGAVQNYGGDDLIEQITPSLRPVFGELQRLRDELEQTADRLAACWIFLDVVARSDNMIAPKHAAAALLRKQQAPGWKTTGQGVP